MDVGHGQVASMMTTCDDDSGIVWQERGAGGCDGGISDRVRLLWVAVKGGERRGRWRAADVGHGQEVVE